MALIPELRPTHAGMIQGNAISMEKTAVGPDLQSMETHPAWPMIARMSLQMAVRISLSNFKVRDLLSLQCGQLIESVWVASEEVPLKVGALQLGWGEFELMNGRMALRLTRLA
jgi:flagellar motor switch protein FliN/FliY